MRGADWDWTTCLRIRNMLTTTEYDIFFTEEKGKSNLIFFLRYKYIYVYISIANAIYHCKSRNLKRCEII